MVKHTLAKKLHKDGGDSTPTGGPPIIKSQNTTIIDEKTQKKAIHNVIFFIPMIMNKCLLSHVEEYAKANITEYPETIKNFAVEQNHDVINNAWNKIQVSIETITKETNLIPDKTTDIETQIKTAIEKHNKQIIPYQTEIEYTVETKLLSKLFPDINDLNKKAYVLKMFYPLSLLKEFALLNKFAMLAPPVLVNDKNNVPTLFGGSNKSKVTKRTTKRVKGGSPTDSNVITRVISKDTRRNVILVIVDRLDNVQDLSNGHFVIKVARDAGYSEAYQDEVKIYKKLNEQINNNNNNNDRNKMIKFYNSGITDNSLGFTLVPPSYSLHYPQGVKISYQNTISVSDQSLLPHELLSMAQNKFYFVLEHTAQYMDCKDFVRTAKDDGTLKKGISNIIKTLGSFSKQYGFFHGDFHNGNVKISPDGDKVKLFDFDWSCIIDYKKKENSIISDNIIGYNMIYGNRPVFTSNTVSTNRITTQELSLVHNLANTPTNRTTLSIIDPPHREFFLLFDFFRLVYSVILDKINDIHKKDPNRFVYDLSMPEQDNKYALYNKYISVFNLMAEKNIKGRMKNDVNSWMFWHGQFEKNNFYTNFLEAKRKVLQNQLINTPSSDTNSARSSISPPSNTSEEMEWSPVPVKYDDDVTSMDIDYLSPKNTSRKGGGKYKRRSASTRTRAKSSVTAAAAKKTRPVSAVTTAASTKTKSAVTTASAAKKTRPVSAATASTKTKSSVTTASASKKTRPVSAATVSTKTKTGGKK